jgi:hypothetical protein
MEIYRYRILEVTCVFKDGSRRVEFELQSECAPNSTKWETLGTSTTLMDARKALLFHAPHQGCGLTAMIEPLSREIRAVVRETLQRVVDDLQFYVDEMEMHRLPARDGANAVRIVAGLIALQRQLT